MNKRSNPSIRAPRKGRGNRNRKSSVPVRPSFNGRIGELNLPAWQAWLPALVVVAGVLAYLNSFAGVFLFDDETNIVRNQHIRRLWSIWDVLTHHRRRPVVNLSLAINYALGGLNVWGYHAFNMAVHILAGLTLFGLVRRTLLSIPDCAGRHIRAKRRHVRLESKRSPAVFSHPRSTAWLALVVSVIWVVHPLQTQSVTYLIQRGESLMGLFYLLTLYCVIRGSDSPRRRFWYLCAIIACALGMGSNAVMVTAPVMVALYDRVFLAGSFRDALRRRWGLYLALAATWTVLPMTGVAQSVLFPSPDCFPHVGFGFSEITPLAYALTQPGVLLHYIWLSLWPYHLCFDYGWPVAKGAGAIAAPAAAIIGLIIATLWALRRKPWLGFSGVWFFLILVPTSSIVPIKDPAVEHRMYLSLASVVIVCVAAGYAGLGHFCERFSVVGSGRRWLTGALVVTVAGTLGYGTLRRNQDYHSEVTIWRTVVAHRPQNARGRSNLGAALIKRDRIDEAIQELREALRLDPQQAHSHTNLGAALVKANRIDQGIVELRTALRLDPREVTAHFHLGKTLSKLGEVAQAVEQYRAGLRIDPNYPTMHSNLGNALAKANRIDEAIESYQEALRIDPYHLPACFNLANTLLSLGRFNEAIERYDRVIRIDPTYADAQSNRGNALLSLGKTDQALEAYRWALRTNPGHLLAHYNMGNALASLGRFDEAIEAYRLTLRINPRYAGALLNLGSAYFELGKLDEAVDAYRQAVRSDPRDANAHFNLGVALHEQGRLDAAIEEYRTALSIEPDKVGVRQALQSAIAAQRRGGTK